MKVLILFASIAAAFANLSSSPTVSNCAGHNDPITFDTSKVTVSPYPVVLPGTFTVGYTIDVTQNTDLSTATFTLTNVDRIFLGIPINLCTLPGIGNLCDKQNLCDVIPDVCKGDNTVGTHSGSISYDVTSLPSSLAEFASGTYTATATVADSTGKELACLTVKFQATNKQ